MPIEIYSKRMCPPYRAVLMTARQLNIDLNVKPTEEYHMNQEYNELNPAQGIPTIVDNGFILWESRAIMQYLCNQYAPDSELYPKEPKKRAIVDRWLNFDMTFANSQKDPLWVKHITGVEPTEDKLNAYENNVKLLDQLIGDNKYLTGDVLTITDLSLLSNTCFLDEYGDFDLSDYPNFKRWLSSLKSELPYYNEINHFDKETILANIEKIKAHIQQQKASQ